MGTNKMLGLLVLLLSARSVLRSTADRPADYL